MNQEAAIAALTERLISEDLADRVEMVLSSPAPDHYRATAIDGSVLFTRTADNGSWRHDVREVTGRNPLSDQSTDRFIGLEVERTSPFPDRRANAYPHAYESIAQFFDGEHAPDLLATHTAAHFVDGYRGQHGSLGAVQARAPFLASGAGIKGLGTIAEATRIVNIAPTIATVLGLEPDSGNVGATGDTDDDALLLRQDGRPERGILDGTTASHAVVFLLDGCNANLLTDVIASGEAPHLASLLAEGTMFGHGSMASLPTATLANHNTAATGAHPGHTGIIHNAWVNRSTGTSIDLLDIESMFWSSDHLRTDVETIFEAIERCRPGSFTSATFEFCDRGATFSTFALVRNGDTSGLPAEDDVRHLDPVAAAASDKYRFFSRVDHLSVTHTLECWQGVHGNELPTLSWCSLALTDEAGHESGPHSSDARAAVLDSDARIGEVLRAVESAGVRDDTAVFVIADHGMEQSDPEINTSWEPELAATGVPYTEVGGGLIYLVDD